MLVINTNLTNISCRCMKQIFLTYAASSDLISRLAQFLIFHLSTFYCDHIRYSVRDKAVNSKDKSTVVTLRSSLG